MSTDHLVSRNVQGRAGRAWFTLLAFLCGTVAVYALTLDLARRSPDHVATAFVWARGTGQPAPNPAAVEEELFSESSPDQAAGQPPPTEQSKSPAASAKSAPQDFAPLDRRNVRAQVDSNKVRGEWLVAIRVSDPDADRAVRVVNDLAERFARRHRPAESEKSRQLALQARANAEQARQQYAAARQRLDDFLTAHFRRHQSDGERPLAEPVPQDGLAPSAPLPERADAPEPAASEAPASAMIDNQLWLDLNRQRDELLQKRDRLLENRTALHPDVQELSAQIGDLDQRLAQIPRRVAVASSSHASVAQEGTTGEDASTASVAKHRRPVPTATSAPPVPQAGTITVKSSDARPDRRESSDSALKDAAEKARVDREAAREYRTLHEEVDRAERIRNHAADQERWAERRPTNAPSLEVQLADHAAPVSVQSRQPAMLAISLAAGLIVAAGVGLFSAGFNSRVQPFADPDQVETALSIPVVGVISSNKEDQEKPRPSRGLLLRSLLRFGLLVILVGVIGMLVVMMNSPGLPVPN